MKNCLFALALASLAAQGAETAVRRFEFTYITRIELPPATSQPGHLRV